VGANYAQLPGLVAGFGRGGAPAPRSDQRRNRTVNGRKVNSIGVLVARRQPKKGLASAHAWLVVALFAHGGPFWRPMARLLRVWARGAVASGPDSACMPRRACLAGGHGGPLRPTWAAWARLGAGCACPGRPAQSDYARMRLCCRKSSCSCSLSTCRRALADR
jgi:hypothetical protein